MTVDRRSQTGTGNRSEDLSGDGVQRTICRAFRSPLSHEAEARPDEKVVRAASPDAPTGFAPTEQRFRNDHVSPSGIDEDMEQVWVPRRLSPAEDMGQVLHLIRESFSFMAGRIDPPSSVGELTAERLADVAGRGEVWVIEDSLQPVATVTLTEKGDALYLGKLAVAESHRGRGLARALVHRAVESARTLGKTHLELQTRFELEENHRVFRALGFSETGRTSHPGYLRPTSVTFRRQV